MQANVSILVLTLNEEQNLPACLDSVKWSDDIVVLDSFSTDQTTEIARAAGGRVIQRKFDNWAAHQNWAMEHIEFKHPWVFYLDADERMPEELRQEIVAIATDAGERRVAFYCGRKNYFMGQWLKHSFRTEAIMRFFQPDKIRFERLVNPTPVLRGTHGHLQSQLLHYNFSKGLTEWIAKHNQYAQWEAMEGMKILRGETGPSPSLFSPDKASRRKALKTLSFHLPFRPLLRFLYMYVLRLGFLDGRAGLVYCRLISMYEYMIVLKMEELKRREENARI
ncbi:MAG TPA: glycosyltransferase family 2 protein [Verrucomicrobiae bacterium]|nr:glycosyltransferase family 2 protein [Verrucomicrobiae bacterium]